MFVGAVSLCATTRCVELVPPRTLHIASIGTSSIATIRCISHRRSGYGNRNNPLPKLLPSSWMFVLHQPLSEQFPSAQQSVAETIASERRITTFTVYFNVGAASISASAFELDTVTFRIVQQSVAQIHKNRRTVPASQRLLLWDSLHSPRPHIAETIPASQRLLLSRCASTSSTIQIAERSLPDSDYCFGINVILFNTPYRRSGHCQPASNALGIHLDIQNSSNTSNHQKFIVLCCPIRSFHGGRRIKAQILRLNQPIHQRTSISMTFKPNFIQ